MRFPVRSLAVSLGALLLLAAPAAAAPGQAPVSDLLLQTIDDNNSLAAWECPRGGTCEPIRTVVRFHARAGRCC